MAWSLTRFLTRNLANNRHVLNCLVQNEPGVLSRVSGILAARGFNIDSLVVCSTEVRDLSRMCIVLRGQDGVVEQARRQLEDLIRITLLITALVAECYSGPCLGRFGLHQHKLHSTRIAPSQGLHPRARLRRGSISRWTHP